MASSHTNSVASRILALPLFFSLCMPLAGHAADGDTSPGDAVGGGSRMERQGDENRALPGSHALPPQTRDNDAARVHARLNSAERKAAIARAAEMDAAAREAFAAQEAGARSGSSAVVPAQASANAAPAQTSAERHSRAGGNPDSSALSASAKKALGSRLRENDNAAGRTASPRSSASVRPKSVTEVMFNAATGMVGMPGLANDRHDPYDPNADQGLGFHADGTARRADGTTGTNAAGAGYNGKRAAAYAGSGLGYSPYGAYGNSLYANEPGYDPVTGQNFRYGDSTDGGRRTMGQGSQGGYGSMDHFDPQQMLFQRGLNYGLGLANSAAEGLFLGVMDSPYGGARARFNFMVDWDGKVNGEGDLLLPWYDSKYTTVYSQFGARTMNAEDSRDRWIGNFGLGQRWYPWAMNDGTGEDAGTLMLGYNAFFDNDFTRSHQRGGVGIEAQYDWLHLASNYYVPLSSWKDSKDFDGDFVKERAAEGWDIRAKGYLPFYRNVAVTGAYTQWYGNNVGMFGASKLERDPKVWSYGLEYTPIPLVSGFVNQRSTEHGRSDTELGLRFTYHFQMPWEEQIRHDKVAELRTVGGSRHEFVDRENRIILEYKAKSSHQVEFVGRSGDVFTFRIRNGFGNHAAGQTVRVSADGVTSLAEAKTEPATFLAQVMEGAGEFLGSIFSVGTAYAAPFYQTYVSDRNGHFSVTMVGHNAGSTVTIQTGTTSRTFTAAELSRGGASGLSFTQSLYTVSAGTTSDNTTVQVTLNGAAGGEQINWSITSPGTTNGATLSAASSNISGATASVTVTGADVRRSVTIKATLDSDSSQTATATVRFGAALPSGFLALFEFDPTGTNTKDWTGAGAFCSQQGGRLPRVNGMAASPSTSVTYNELVDGFGAFGELWPTGVPHDHHWSGTEDSDDPTQSSWYIAYSGGSVAPQWGFKSTGKRVICVP